MNKRLWLLVLWMAASAILTACAGEPYAPPMLPTASPTVTPNPGEIALQMIQQQMAAEATSQVVGLQLEATRQVVQATATEHQRVIYAGMTEQARRDAVSTAEQKRADIAATQARLDMVAATEQAREDIRETQIALATATYTSMTETAIPPHATLTQIARVNEIAIQQNEVEQSNLDLKQAQDTNVIEWAVPLAVVAALLVGFGAHTWYQNQIREVRDENGEIATIIYKNKRAVRPDLFAAPVLELETLNMPALAAPQEQSEIVKRAQAIKALSVMPDMPATSAATFAPLFGEGRKDAFDIIEGDAAPALVDAEAVKALDKDWKESGDE